MPFWNLTLRGIRCEENLIIQHDVFLCQVKKFLKQFLILAVLGLPCRERGSPGCSEWELLFVVMLRAVLQVASLAVRRKL